MANFFLAQAASAVYGQSTWPWQPMLQTPDGTLYGRVFGAIGWPSKAPGAAVVLGEEYNREPGTGTRHMNMLAIKHEYDLSRLFRWCLFQTPLFEIDQWYARLDTGMMRQLWKFNKDSRKKRTPTLQLSMAPYSEDGHISYHLGILKTTLNPETHTLHGLKENDIPVLSIQPEEVADLRDSDYPSVAAVAYAVVAMVELQGAAHDELISKPVAENTVSATTGY